MLLDAEASRVPKMVRLCIQGAAQVPGHLEQHLCSQVLTAAYQVFQVSVTQCVTPSFCINLSGLTVVVSSAAAPS